jgi:hypothetical protein
VVDRTVWQTDGMHVTTAHGSLAVGECRAWGALCDRKASNKTNTILSTLTSGLYLAGIRNMSIFACILSMSLHVACILVCLHCMPHLHGWLTHAPRAHPAWLADGGQAYRDTYPTNPLVRDYAYACMSGFACVLSMSLHVVCILVCWHCMPPLHQNAI